MPSAGQVKYRRRGIVIDDNRERLDFEPHQSSRLNRDRHIALIKSPIGAREVLRRPRTAPQQAQIGSRAKPQTASPHPRRLAVRLVAAVGANHLADNEACASS
jgi:hypothetical protein